MKKQQGFTLVELVIVIVLLGILAATVAPRFIGLQGSAHAAVLETTAASIDSAAKMVYSKAAIQGLLGEAATTVNIGGDDVNIVYGFPQAADADIKLVVDDLDDFEVDETADGVVAYYPDGYAYDPDDADVPDCYVQYTEAGAAGGESSSVAVITGC